MPDSIFLVGFALLLTHELDAIGRHEWRMFPLVRRLEDGVAYRLFVSLHFPLLVFLLWLLTHPSANVRYWFQLSMDIFFMAHLGLHYLLRSDVNNEFTNTFSKSIIVLIASAGFVHIILLVNETMM